MPYAMQVAITGGPEVLTRVDLAMPDPGPGEVVIENRAIGLNFADIYYRTGVYPAPLPFVPGIEGAGVVAAVGADVGGLSPGDRVAYAGLPLGAYASHRLLPATRAILLPEGIAFETAAAAFLKGLTADMLFATVYRLTARDTVLIHGAAGGLGSYLCAWASDLGARVIGATGSDAKAALARAAGADAVIVGRDADFAAEAMRLTGDRGVDLVIDGVGGGTLAKSLAAVRRFGTVASIGQVGGPIAPIPVGDISRRSAALARPSIIAYTSDQAAYEAAAQRVIAAIARGLVPAAGASFPLAEAARAHAALAAGDTTGSAVLVP